MTVRNPKLQRALDREVATDRQLFMNQILARLETMYDIGITLKDHIENIDCDDCDDYDVIRRNVIRAMDQLDDAIAEAIKYGP